MKILGLFWTVVGAGGRNLGRGRYRKMRLVQTKRMSLLARRSNPKWRNARVTNTQKERKKERKTIDAFVNRYCEDIDWDEII